MALKLTNKQRRVLVFVYDYDNSHGFPPTLREIGEHMEIVVRAAYDYRNALWKKGFLDWKDQKNRSITLTEKGMAACRDGVDE